MFQSYMYQICTRYNTFRTIPFLLNRSRILQMKYLPRVLFSLYTKSLLRFEVSQVQVYTLFILVVVFVEKNTDCECIWYGTNEIIRSNNIKDSVRMSSVQRSIVFACFLDVFRSLRESFLTLSISNHFWSSK